MSLGTHGSRVAVRISLAITKLISEGSNIRELISNEGEINLNVNTIRLAEKLLTY